MSSTPADNASLNTKSRGCGKRFQVSDTDGDGEEIQDGGLKENIETTAGDTKLIQNWHLQNVRAFCKLHKCHMVHLIPMFRRCAMMSCVLTEFDGTSTTSHSQEMHDRSQEVRDLVFSGAHRNLMLHHHVALSASASSILLRCSSKSDVATTVFRSQEVRHVVFSGDDRNLMFYHHLPLSASA